MLSGRTHDVFKQQRSQSKKQNYSVPDAAPRETGKQQCGKSDPEYNGNRQASIFDKQAEQLL